MVKKICKKCNSLKKIDEFHKKPSGEFGRHSYCKKCAIENSKLHYQANKNIVLPRMRDYSNSLKKQIKTAVDRIKQNYGCCFCEESESCCLDFHHVDPKEKEHTISEMLSMKNVSILVKEINKCVCVCSNCHRKIHAGLLSGGSEYKICISDKDIHINREDVSLISRTKEKIVKYCECGIEINRKSTYCKSCFPSKINRRKIERPSKDELHDLVWKSPTKLVATKFGVSDNAISSWCKDYRIDKPPRGYWQKLSKKLKSKEK